MKKMIMFLKNIAMWLFWKPRLFWLSVGGLICIPTALLWIKSSDLAIRISGLSLQVFGLFCVLNGLRQTRLLFGKPSLIVIVKRWIASTPKYGGKVVSFNLHTSGTSAASARFHVWRGIDPNATDYERINTLEINITMLRDELADIEKGHIKRCGQIEKAIKSDFDAIDGRLQQLNDKVERAETDGLHLAFVGTLFILFGSILSTMAQEIQKYMQ